MINQCILFCGKNIKKKLGLCRRRPCQRMREINTSVIVVSGKLRIGLSSQAYIYISETSLLLQVPAEQTTSPVKVGLLRCLSGRHTVMRLQHKILVLVWAHVKIEDYKYLEFLFPMLFLYYVNKFMWL